MKVAVCRKSIFAVGSAATVQSLLNFAATVAVVSVVGCCCCCCSSYNCTRVQGRIRILVLYFLPSLLSKGVCFPVLTLEGMGLEFESTENNGFLVGNLQLSRHNFRSFGAGVRPFSGRHSCKSLCLQFEHRNFTGSTRANKEKVPS